LRFSTVGRVPEKAFARRRAGRQEAEDIVQDAYLHLLQRGTAGTLEHPRSYLYRTAANLAVDLARKAKVRLRHLQEGTHSLCNAEGPPSPEAAAVSALELQHLETALSGLPQICRQAFWLNRLEGLSHSEIAQRLGVSVRTVDRQLARAAAQLRDPLGAR
jgi:RNA polymerase sigma-70 factor (ECF subfamily)